MIETHIILVLSLYVSKKQHKKKRITKYVFC